MSYLNSPLNSLTYGKGKYMGTEFEEIKKACLKQLSTLKVVHLKNAYPARMLLM
jgi:hypothetical protein